MERQSIYRRLANYYDLLYGWKDYEAEAKHVRKLVRRYQRSEGNDLLEVACGTGGHAGPLAKHFNVTATDANQGMLRVARSKLPNVRFRRADMTALRLGRQFDAVVCLFSSIGYVRTEARLRKAIRGMAAHLKPGGVLIVEPWFTKADYKVGNPHIETYGSKDLKLVRLAVSAARGSVSVLDMHYSVAERGKPVRHHVDRHELGMFEPEQYIALMRAAGLRAVHVKRGLTKGRGLYVGVKT